MWMWEALAYGLRTIFPMVEILDYVEKYAAKDHWILNYSNPAAIVALALKKLRPNARIINICDMPVAIINSFADILNCDPHDIKPYYFGLNHFGWFTDVWVNGEYLGQNEGIFNSFEFEITHLVDINKKIPLLSVTVPPKDFDRICGSRS